jgi:hypothetical protein
MSATSAAAPAGFGPYTVLDLHELTEDGKGFELEDGWLIEDHQPELRVQVLTLAEKGYAAAPPVRAGSVLVAEIAADKPFEVSFDPAVLPEF